MGTYIVSENDIDSRAEADQGSGGLRFVLAAKENLRKPRYMPDFSLMGKTGIRQGGKDKENRGNRN